MPALYLGHPSNTLLLISAKHVMTYLFARQDNRKRLLQKSISSPTFQHISDRPLSSCLIGCCVLILLLVGRAFLLALFLSKSCLMISPFSSSTYFFKKLTASCFSSLTALSYARRICSGVLLINTCVQNEQTKGFSEAPFSFLQQKIHMFICGFITAPLFDARRYFFTPFFKPG